MATYVHELPHPERLKVVEFNEHGHVISAEWHEPAAVPQVAWPTPAPTQPWSPLSPWDRVTCGAGQKSTVDYVTH